MAQFSWPPTSVDATGLATEAKQDTIIAGLQSIDANVLTDTQLRATPVPVSGPLTDSELRATAVPVSAASLPLPADAATETTLSSIDTAVAELNARLAGSLVPEEFDYQDITYVLAGNGAGEIATVVYKTGGSGGTTVATLTMTYDANDRLATVTRS